MKKALVTKWCLDESDLIDQIDLRSAEEERSGEEESDIIVITSEELAEVDQDIVASEDNIFKRNVAIRPRKPKYQTNFI